MQQKKRNFYNRSKKTLKFFKIWLKKINPQKNNLKNAPHKKRQEKTIISEKRRKKNVYIEKANFQIYQYKTPRKKRQLRENDKKRPNWKRQFLNTAK